ncbi:hypothetical protein CHS0354_010485, partial [Potamilus streckersoni]
MILEKPGGRLTQSGSNDEIREDLKTSDRLPPKNVFLIDTEQGGTVPKTAESNHEE